MNYLEFVKNEETQMVEIIRFRDDDAAESFYTKMEEADDVECLKLIHSLYIEVIDYINEEGGNFRKVQLNGTYYEMHFHMFTTYLIRLFYNSQFWEILLNAFEFFSYSGDFFRRSGILDVEDWFTMTFFNILRKLIDEPIENFVKEVQIVQPEYTLEEETMLTDEDYWWDSLSEDEKRMVILKTVEEAHKNFPNAELMTFPPID